MSPAVEQTLPPREVEGVGRRESGSHAAEPYYNIDAARTTTTTAAGRDEGFASPVPVLAPAPAPAPATEPERSSYYLQRQYQDAMEGHEFTTSSADSHVVDAQAPVLPPKSALRASRLLAGLKICPPTEPLEYVQSHHEEYLSSEEDASSTSGDFSDFEYDSSSDDLPSPTEECSKHEVTARVVSVIYSGKPSVIDVPQIRRSISPHSIERPLSMSGLSERASYNHRAKSRRTSVSTTASSRSSRSPHPARPLPPRSSSMQPPTDAMKAKLSFLRIDPYANGSSYSLDPSPAESCQPLEIRSAEELERPKTPKSPAGNMFRGVARAMSLMKRRSVPRLNQAYLSPDGEAPSQPNSPTPESIPEETPKATKDHQEVVQESKSEPEIETAAIAAPAPAPAPAPAATPSRPSRPPPRPQLQPVTHDEIIRIAKRNEQNKHLSTARTFHGEQMLESPISPMSPLAKDNSSTNTTTTSKRISSFGFGRRRMSVKLTGGRFQL